VRRAYLLFIFLLLAIGVLGFAGVFAGREVVYKLPSDQLMGAVLVGGVAAAAILTAVVGGGLAVGFGRLSGELSKDKTGGNQPMPGIEKRFWTWLTSFGEGLKQLPILNRIYGDNPPVTPYTPTYSFQSVPEDKETRQWIIGTVIGVAALAAYVVWRNLNNLLEIAGRFTVTEWVVAVVLSVVLIGGTGAMGAGLAFWFFRTQEEQNKTAKAGPLWPAAEVSALEAELKANPPVEVFNRMRFLDKFLIVGNVLLVLIILGVAAVWVGPGVAEVARADAARYATWTPVPTPTGPPVPVVSIGPSLEELTAEFGELPAGNAAEGEQIFNVQQPCKTCHVDQPLGPPIAGIASRAGSARPGYSAEIYLFESVKYPSAHIVSGFTDGIMPQNFKDILSPQQFADLVAYLQTVQ